MAIDMNALQSFVNDSIAKYKMFGELGGVVTEVRGLEQYKTELNTLIEAAKVDLRTLRDQIARGQTDGQAQLKSIADSVENARKSAAQQLEQVAVDVAAIAAKREVQIKAIDSRVTEANIRLSDAVARGNEAMRDYSDKLALAQSQVKEWDAKLASAKAKYAEFMASLAK